ncbi:MAG: succinate dehydrogenase, hydrophobic membrane anchor protein [Arenicella sp.]
MALQSPLSKAIGLGSAKHGFSHWWLQRLSAVALIPLSLWFVYSLVSLISADYATVVAWMQSPLRASLLVIFVLTTLYHAQTGLQVVIEDYIHTKWVNLILMYAMKFAAVVLAAIAVISVLKVSIGS